MYAPTMHGPGPNLDQSVDVRIGAERALAGGWSYQIRVGRGPGERNLSVTLGWRDHDLWSGGASPPSRVIEQVVRYLLERRISLPDSFDAARARYLAPGIDAELRETL
jgi:hypothetical protein